MLTLAVHARSAVGDHMEELEEEEEDGEDGDAPVTVKLFRLRLFEFRARMSMATYRNKAFNYMRGIMMTDQFYADLELPTAPDFWIKLDGNSDLLAYDNGIMNLHEPDGSFRFYAKGSVPSHFLVSYSTGFDYKGPVHIPPGDISLTWEQRESLWSPDHPSFSAEQRASMKAFEDATIRKAFFTPATYNAVVYLFGSLLFGSQRLKRLPLLLGERGDNSKSRMVAMLQNNLGDYAGTLKKAAVVEPKGAARDNNPDAASPFLVDCYKRKVVFVGETERTDKLKESTVKSLSGGDKIPIRANYGNPFQAVFSPVTMFVSNYAPKHSGEPPMTKRLYPISCDASFKPDCVVEDPANGIWKAMPQADFEAFVALGKHDLALLLICYARAFADANFDLPPVPPSDAKDAVDEGAVGASFESYFLENYESTLKKDADGRATREIDWDTYKENGAMPLSQLISSHKYDTQAEEAVSTADAKAVLTRLGFKPTKVEIPPSHRGECGQKSYALGVKACKRIDEEEGEAEEGAAVGRGAH